MIVQWTDDALADLENILNHAYERSPDEAANIATRIDAMQKRMTLFPRAAFYDEKLNTFERYVPKTRVILVYRLSADAITIIAAFHTRRNAEGK